MQWLTLKDPLHGAGSYRRQFLNLRVAEVWKPLYVLQHSSWHPTVLCCPDRALVRTCMVSNAVSSSAFSHLFLSALMIIYALTSHGVALQIPWGPLVVQKHLSCKGELCELCYFSYLSALCMYMYISVSSDNVLIMLQEVVSSNTLKVIFFSPDYLLYTLMSVITHISQVT